MKHHTCSDFPNSQPPSLFLSHLTSHSQFLTFSHISLTPQFPCFSATPRRPPVVPDFPRLCCLAPLSLRDAAAVVIALSAFAVQVPLVKLSSFIVWLSFWIVLFFFFRFDYYELVGFDEILNVISDLVVLFIKFELMIWIVELL